MLTTLPEPEPSVPRGWSARLNLEYVQRGAETVLLRRSHEGPLRVQRPFLESSGVCQTYVLHPPGGLVGGDSLDVQVDVSEGARALLTTPGATKFYRSAGLRARQNQEFRVGPNASVEWLPQETIVFDDAIADTRTIVHLEQESRCALWELTCLGRPAGARPFVRGTLRQRLELHAAGRPVLLESLRVCGDEALTATWGFQGFPVYGTLLLHALPPELLSTVRDVAAPLWSPHSDHRFGATHLPFGEGLSTIVCRYLGSSSEHCKLLFVHLWQALRPHLIGLAAEPPRVWQT